jgi:hypothetical protein
VKVGTSKEDEDSTKLLVRALFDELKDQNGSKKDSARRQNFAKLQIKPLERFNEDIADYYSWTIKSKNFLGRAEYEKFLEDKDYALAHPKENTYLFYLLESSLLGGDFAHLAAEFAETQDSHTLWNQIQTDGAPEIIKRDNRKTQTGSKWTAVSRRALVKERLTEPYHSNQNLAERYGGDVKGMLVHDFRESNCPLGYWDYALEWCTVVTCFTSSGPNDSETSPQEGLYGDKPDISFLRFYLFEEIEYYDKTQRSPENPMLPGRFLGVDMNAGNAFTYLILTGPQTKKEVPCVITQSVICHRKYQQRQTDSVPAPDLSILKIESSSSKLASVNLTEKPFLHFFLLQW